MGNLQTELWVVMLVLGTEIWKPHLYHINANFVAVHRVNVRELCFAHVKAAACDLCLWKRMEWEEQGGGDKGLPFRISTCRFVWPRAVVACHIITPS